MAAKHSNMTTISPNSVLSIILLLLLRMLIGIVQLRNHNFKSGSKSFWPLIIVQIVQSLFLHRYQKVLPLLLLLSLHQGEQGYFRIHEIIQRCIYRLRVRQLILHIVLHQSFFQECESLRLSLLQLDLQIELFVRPDFTCSIQVPICEDKVTLDTLLYFRCFGLQVLRIVDHLLPEVPLNMLILLHHLGLSLQEFALLVL